MKITRLALAIATFLFSAQGEEAGNGVQKLGAFVFKPSPQISIKREIPGFKLPFFFASPKDGFAPNINFIEERSGSDWNAYVAASLEMIKGLKAEIIEAPAALELISKLPCQRFVYRHTAAGKDVRAICFLIQLQPEQSLVATFSALHVDGDKWDAAVAESIRTIAPARD